MLGSIDRNESGDNEYNELVNRMRAQTRKEAIRVTQHAQQEMVLEDITLDEVLETIETGQILENYPEHRRGACCLLNGITRSERPLHIVCTTARSMLIIITVYEPKPPKWITPSKRRSER
jgi:hypothetical protein